LNLPRTLTLLTLATCVFTGCGDQDDGKASYTAHDSELGIFAPGRLRESLAVDPANIVAFVEVNNRSYQMEPSGNQFVAVVEGLRPNQDATIRITFRENFPDGRQLNLAQTGEKVERIGATDHAFTVQRGEYSYAYDIDNDGVSNLEERNNGTDPFVAENVANRRINVTFNIPQAINDPELVQVYTFFGDLVVAPRSIDGNRRTYVTSLPGNTEVRIEVRIVQKFGTRDIIVAEAITTAPRSQNDAVFDLTDDNFDFSMDEDNDGKTNLQEMQNGDNPLVPG